MNQNLTTQRNLARVILANALNQAAIDRNKRNYEYRQQTATIEALAEMGIDGAERIPDTDEVEVEFGEWIDINFFISKYDGVDCLMGYFPGEGRSSSTCFHAYAIKVIGEKITAWVGKTEDPEYVCQDVRLAAKAAAEYADALEEPYIEYDRLISQPGYSPLDYTLSAEPEPEPEPEPAERLQCNYGLDEPIKDVIPADMPLVCQEITSNPRAATLAMDTLESLKKLSPEMKLGDFVKFIKALNDEPLTQQEQSRIAFDMTLETIPTHHAGCHCLRCSIPDDEALCECQACTWDRYGIEYTTEDPDPRSTDEHIGTWSIDYSNKTISVYLPKTARRPHMTVYVDGRWVGSGDLKHCQHLVNEAAGCDVWTATDDEN